MNNEAPRHLSAITLDTLQLGGLSPEAEQETRAHLAQCPKCSQRLSEAFTSTEHFVKVVQPRTAEQLRQRMERPQPPLSRPGVRWGLVALVGRLLGRA
ncbi:MAG TPA: zf-HC2 domain-containing protein [Archangium sp.]|nr:zf-HC2 domain-containing protein [Archangium sp.]